MTADCRDKDIKKTIQESKCSWQCAGQEALSFTCGGINPIVQVIQYMDVLIGVLHDRTL